MAEPVKVRTDGDNFASIEHGRVLVELSKDGNSPSCPSSWTWELWFDGCAIDGTCDEATLAASVKEATASLDTIIGELSAVRDYLTAYGVFGE